MASAKQARTACEAAVASPCPLLFLSCRRRIVGCIRQIDALPTRALPPAPLSFAQTAFFFALALSTHFLSLSCAFTVTCTTRAQYCVWREPCFRAASLPSAFDSYSCAVAQRVNSHGEAGVRRYIERPRMLLTFLGSAADLRRPDCSSAFAQPV